MSELRIDIFNSGLGEYDDWDYDMVCVDVDPNDTIYDEAIVYYATYHYY